MITPKDYQTRVLDSLREFFRQCSKNGRPETAFQNVLNNNKQPLAPYIPVQAAGLTPGMPYVCLRVPTGGGKTLLACNAAGIAMTELLHAERAVVLWLVPSNTILDQTADALRDPRHPYRRALELACGSVEVVTIEEALRLPRATVDGQTVVIVSTIQAFRVEDTTGRKVYDGNNSHMVEHLLNVPADRLAELLSGADGKPKPSLVNMLRLRRPIVIVDEAHNARTLRSFIALGSVRPSCIVEFTATPSTGADEVINGKKEPMPPSNVLHRVSAAELKAADMIKLPLRVITRHPSQRDPDSEQSTAFQQFLLPESALTVSDERVINFKTMSYEPSWLYEGGFQFKNHYFGPKPGELLEKRADGTLREEFKCAQFLDQLPEVKFWVRNLANKATSFRLQTSKNWFYPDFLCQLNDGRVLVAEYKGEHLYADAEEKRAVGAVWESRSGSKCLFVMPLGNDLESIRRKISGK
jgi:hypothetical protein